MLAYCLEQLTQKLMLQKSFVLQPNHTLFFCRERTVSASGQVILDMNVARRNQANAYLGICLAFFMIAELFIFTAILHRTAVQLLLGPVNRILTVLRSNAAEMLSTLEKNEASTCVRLFCLFFPSPLQGRCHCAAVCCLLLATIGSWSPCSRSLPLATCPAYLLVHTLCAMSAITCRSQARTSWR